MQSHLILTAAAAAASALLLQHALRRLALSRAKHPSLAGHSRLAKRVTRLIPGYAYDEHSFFASDGAPESVQQQRRAGLDTLSGWLQSQCPMGVGFTEQARGALPDLQFTGRYRVPFQYSDYLRSRITMPSAVASSEGVLVRDLDGHALYDLAGSYGVNVFGYDFYRDCIAEAVERVGELGPVLGSYHPCVLDNVKRIQALSGQAQVTFHMSGTEAVMQAVRLARYHTRRSHIVRFSGAYHGWWDDVQPGPGNPMPPRDVYTLRECDERSLRVLRSRSDIACVLINPIQAMHPNASAPADGSLIDSSRQAYFDREAYTRWLQQLRAVCTERGIALILDEVFLGFRLAKGGAQEYFGVKADLVTYGKTLGGGLPVGVVAGSERWMQRYRPDRPADVCLARGTFNAHPYVMAAMNAFLRRLDDPSVDRVYRELDTTWTRRKDEMNGALEAAGLPLRVEGLPSVWTILFTQPSRYNWMLQFYLRRSGLLLSWVGSGRMIFSLNYSNEQFAEVTRRLLVAARQMQGDGWWWQNPTITNQKIRRTVLREMLNRRLAAFSA